MEKLTSTQTKDYIAAQIRREIFSGRFADGEELTQEALAAQLEVSRMPVREALQTLESEGLLVRLPNRHMRVVGLREEAVQETMRVIAAIEAELAGMLMERSCPLDYLEQRVGFAFHAGLSQPLDNPYLSRLHLRLLEGYPRYLWDTRPAASLPDHKAIFAALRQKDSALANKEIHCFFRQMADSLLEGIINHEQP